MSQPLPWNVVGEILAGRPRPFRPAAQAAVRRLRPPLRLLGAGHLPPAGPALLTLNHYTSPAYPAWWLNLTLSAVVPFEVHWVITANLRHLGWLAPLSRWALRRLARVYGFTLMPAMPPDPAETTERSRAVRHALDYTQHNPTPVVGMSPEGRDFAAARLGFPAPGVGRFLLLLHARCAPVIPVGVYEDEGLCLCFGPPYRLDVPPGLPAAERDRQTSDQVMRAIANLLPPALRGEYNNQETHRRDTENTEKS